MRLCYNFHLLLFFVLFLISGSSGATDYNVAIRQLNPDRWIYKATCNDEKDLCHVFMGIEPQNDTYDVDDLELDIGVVFKNNGAYFQFKSGADYFFLPDGDNRLYLSMAQEKIDEHKIALYVRHPMAKNDPPSSSHLLLVVRPKPKMLAELEITIEPVVE